MQVVHSHSACKQAQLQQADLKEIVTLLPTDQLGSDNPIRITSCRSQHWSECGFHKQHPDKDRSVTAVDTDKADYYTAMLDQENLEGCAS